MPQTREATATASHFSSDPRHGSVMVGIPTSSGASIGRLDAGQLEIVLVQGNLRSEQQLNESSLTPDAIVKSLEIRGPGPLVGHDLSVFASVHYALVPDELRASIEREPNSFLQGRMRRAISGLIEETLLEFESKGVQTHPLAVEPELARLKALSVPFEDSGQIPKKSEDDLRELFYLHLLDVQFLPSEQSPAVNSLRPFVSYRLPTEVGDGCEFKHCYNTYEVDWSTIQSCRQSGGFQFMTRAVRSMERTPIVVVKMYEKGIHGHQDRLLGTSVLLTHEFVDVQQPFKRVWAALQPPLIYEILPNVEAPTPVARFRAVWRATKFLEDHGVGFASILKAVTRSIRFKGAPMRLDFNWAIRVRQGTSFRGELYFLSRFIPATATPLSGANFFVEGNLGAASVMKDLEFLSHSSPTDAFGAPLPRISYNPNLPIVQRFGKGTLINQWEFERLDYEDIRQHEQFTELLNSQTMWKWHTFLCERHEGGDPLPAGELQWEEIEKAAQAMGKTSSSGDFSWVNTVNDLCGPDLPRFLVEVWCADKFCGECLLPKLIDIKRVHQSRTLFRLFASDPKRSLSRLDRRKAVATHAVRGWIHMQATWRCLNSKAGRFSLAIRELRDISTSSHNETQTQPISPVVKVYEYNVRTKSWREAMVFSPFEYALYFLNEGQSKRLMGTQWQWDDRLMGGPEPEWKNYFSWDEPGKLTAEEREVVVPLTVEYQIKPRLIFENIIPEQNNNGVRIWRLCKNGIPPLMRPYVWTQLSGAYRLRRIVNAEFKKSIPEAFRNGAKSAYAFLVKQSEFQEAQVFQVIDEDLEDLKAELGLDVSFVDDLREVLRALVSFSAAAEINTTAVGGTSLEDAGSSENRAALSSRDRFFTCGRESSGVGVPIAYLKGIARIAHSLMLDFSGLRIPKEFVFYILFSLMGARSSRHNIPKASFRDYFSLFDVRHSNETADRKTFADDIPFAVRDALFIRAAIEVLHPKKSELLKICGVHLEELLYGCLTSLFAGFLPSQSLFRLWDMVFNVLFSPHTLVEANVTYGGLQVRAQQELLDGKHVSRSNVCCITERSSWSPSETPEVIDFLRESHGRRVIISFTYGLLLAVLGDLPPEPTPREIKENCKAHMLALRNPADVVSYVDKGDFVLFTSALHVRYISQLAQFYIDVKSTHLTNFKLQNRLIQEVVQPWPELHGHYVPSQIAMNLTDRPIDAEQAFYPKAVGVGLCTQDLKDVLYPCLKYHTLFAPPAIRALPHNALARIIIKIDELDLYGTPLGCTPEVTVKFAKQVQTKLSRFYAENYRYVWKDANVFLFVVRTPPPYKVQIQVKDPDGRMIVELKRGFVIRKLLCQGEAYRLFSSPDLRGAEKATLNVSWYMYTNSWLMFLPGSTGQWGGTPIGFGCGTWGDLASLNTTKVTISTEKVVRQMRDELDPFKPMGTTEELKLVCNPDNVPTPMVVPSISGVNRYTLEELFFHSMPALLPFGEAIIRLFGPAQESKDPNEIASAVVCLREVVAALIIASKGTPRDKASLLFDLYGHHEADRPTGSSALYYDDDPANFSPEMLKETATLHSYLPSGALSSIVKDERTLVNCISLAESIALTQVILRRSCVHVDNLSAFQIAASIFDPSGHVPRILGATLSSIQPIERFDDKHDPNNHLRTAMIRVVDGPDATPTEEFHEVTRDVTAAVARCFEETATSTGAFEFNFTTLRSLSSMEIKDPFPGVSKTLRIAVSSTGSFDSVEVISVEVDGNGNFWAGSGGNLKRRPAYSPGYHTTRMSTRRHQSSSPTDRLADASFVFDVHSTVIDKQLFMTRLLRSEILSDALRRPTSMDRSLVERPVVAVMATIPLSLDRETLCQLRPLSFRSSDKSSRHGKGESGASPSTSGPSPFSATSGGRIGAPAPSDDGQTTAFLEDGSPGDTIAPLSPPIQSEMAADHEAPLPDGMVGKLTVTVIRATALFNTEFLTKMDPYCVVSVGGSEQRTTTKTQAGRNPEWDEALNFQYEGQETMKVEVWEDDPLKDDYVGSTMISLTDLVDEAISASRPVSREAEYRLFRGKGNDEDAGTITLQLDIDISPDQNFRRSPSQLMSQVSSISSPNNIAPPPQTTRRSSSTQSRSGRHGSSLTREQIGAPRPETRLKVVVRSARDLYNTETFSKMDPYCKCFLGARSGRTQTLEGAGRTPNWHASFMFLLESGSSYPPLKFEVYDADMLRDDFVGSAEFRLDTLDPETKDFNGELSLTRPDGSFGGYLSVQVTIDTAPTGPLPDVLRLTVTAAKFPDSADDGSPGLRKAAGYVSAVLDGELTDGRDAASLNTTIVKSDDGETLVWNEVLDFRYDGQQMLKFKVTDDRSNDLLGQCAFDLWGVLKQAVPKTSGDVALSRRKTRDGRLTFALEFLRFPEGVTWPENLRVTPKDYECVKDTDVIGKMDPYLIVKMEDKQHRTPTLSGAGPVGRFATPLVFENVKSPNIDVELWDDDKMGRDDFVGSGRFSIVDMLMSQQPDASTWVNLTKKGVYAGRVAFRMKSHRPPQPPPQYCKLTVHKALCMEDLDTIGKMDPYVVATMGAWTDRTATAVGQGTKPKWNQSFVGRYFSEPMIKFSILDEDALGASDEIGAAEVSLWEILADGTRLFDHMALPIMRKGEKKGKLIVSLDFFDQSIASTEILGVRVGFRSGRDLGLAEGEMFSKMDPMVVVKINESIARTNPVIGGGSDPIFGDEEIFVTWPATGPADSILFEVWDKDQVPGSGPLSSQAVHVWEVFRDPKQTWVGHVPLMARGRPAGRLHVAMQLICKASVNIALRCGPQPAEPDGWIYCDTETVDYKDTVRMLKEKVRRACWATASQYENAELVRVISQLRLDDRYEVIWRSEQGNFILEDHARLSDYEDDGLLPKEVSRTPILITIIRKEGVETPQVQIDGQWVQPKIVELAESRATKYPMAISTFPPPTTTAITDSVNSAIAGQPITDKASAKLRLTTVEIRPNLFVSSQNLAWVQVPTVDSQRGLAHLNILKSRARKVQWVPCIRCRNIEGGRTEVVLLNFQSGAAQMEDPARSAPMVFPNSAIVTSFAFGDTPPMEYELPMTATARRRTAAVAPWRAPDFAFGSSHQRRSGRKRRHQVENSVSSSFRTATSSDSVGSYESDPDFVSDLVSEENVLHRASTARNSTSRRRS